MAALLPEQPDGYSDDQYSSNPSPSNDGSLPDNPTSRREINHKIVPAISFQASPTDQLLADSTINRTTKTDSGIYHRTIVITELYLTREYDYILTETRRMVGDDDTTRRSFLLGSFAEIYTLDIEEKARQEIIDKFIDLNLSKTELSKTAVME